MSLVARLHPDFTCAKKQDDDTIISNWLYPSILSGNPACTRPEGSVVSPAVQDAFEHGYMHFSHSSSNPQYVCASLEPAASDFSSQLCRNCYPARLQSSDTREAQRLAPQHRSVCSNPPLSLSHCSSSFMQSSLINCEGHFPGRPGSLLTSRALRQLPQSVLRASGRLDRSVYHHLLTSRR